MIIDDLKDFEIYPIFGFMFRQPYNKLSSDAKVIFAIRQKERDLIEKYKNLGPEEIHYALPKPCSFDEIMDMTGLTSQQVHDAHIELEKMELYKGVDFIGIET